MQGKRNQHLRRPDPMPSDWVQEDRGYTTPCWIWQLSTDKRKGYGRTERLGYCCTAHRFYYLRLVGAIPDGYEVDHLCRVKACVNPDHLEAVPTVVNIRRKPATKLTRDDVIAIRENTTLSLRQLAKQHGVSKGIICHVRAGRRWKNMDVAE